MLVDRAPVVSEGPAGSRSDATSQPLLVLSRPSGDPTGQAATGPSGRGRRQKPRQDSAAPPRRSDDACPPHVKGCFRGLRTYTRGRQVAVMALYSGDREHCPACRWLYERPWQAHIREVLPDGAYTLAVPIRRWRALQRALERAQIRFVRITTVDGQVHVLAEGRPTGIYAPMTRWVPAPLLPAYADELLAQAARQGYAVTASHDWSRSRRRADEPKGYSWNGDTDVSPDAVAAYAEQAGAQVTRSGRYLYLDFAWVPEDRWRWFWQQLRLPVPGDSWQTWEPARLQAA